eukprot:CAMPEP_0181233266 /NCGR_PEP_ID=MMETSP1096-20121128/36235_1 /TAXON_ID=156174 ORGANISM="Chrysochromulina ericina, Strain CCMP281" /NCGR_SAMPLE_ID=MMETSP1096 /ASSEMBLY_ACC=CAM_ASM_000453 /LENGTH=307 /DNA_ID=CAMNT_0023327737 /DNA_START=221 /DNA_END=1144 /DNA_ORIENTATION=-
MASQFNSGLGKSGGAYQKMSDLVGLRVCTYQHNWNTHLFQGLLVSQQVSRETTDECCSLLADRQVDAVVLDSVSLAAWRFLNKRTDLTISSEINEYAAGVIYPEASVAPQLEGLRNRLDPEIMAFMGSQRATALSEKWFPLTSVDTDLDAKVEWVLVVPTLILIGLYAILQLLRWKALRSEASLQTADVTAKTSHRIQELEADLHGIRESMARIEAALGIRKAVDATAADATAADATAADSPSADSPSADFKAADFKAADSPPADSKAAASKAASSLSLGRAGGEVKARTVHMQRKAQDLKAQDLKA